MAIYLDYTLIKGCIWIKHCYKLYNKTGTRKIIVAVIDEYELQVSISAL